jgi:hypothetical protein
LSATTVLSFKVTAILTIASAYTSGLAFASLQWR